MITNIKIYRSSYTWPFAVILVVFIAGCQAVPSSPPPQETVPLEVTSTQTPVAATSTTSLVATENISSPSPADTSIPVILTPSYNPAIRETWKRLPVIPETISERVVEIYQQGIQSGLNPRAFSKIGDCETQTTFFLNLFGCCENRYSLGEYSYLYKVILYFKESYSRTSLAAGRGFSAASVLTTFWSDPEQCKANQNPIVCEIDQHKPAFALVMFGTNDVNRSVESFENNMRVLLDEIIARNVVPILATKADNLEGDESINAVIAYLAYEYEIPLWNLWRALQELPNGGLQNDMVHLTYADPLFDDPEIMKFGWPVRNLTALQVLDMVMQELADK